MIPEEHMPTNDEIARLLRTTEDNASRFVERVRAELTEPISDEDLVEIVRSINPRQISLSKVIHAVRDYQKRAAARAARRATTTRGGAADAESARPVAPIRPRTGGTLIGRIDDILTRNWDRAEREGLKPQRIGAEAFVDAVRDYTDPRDATHARIIEALEELERQIVMITPNNTADRVRELAF
jgi:hypothetical protein